MYVGVDSFGQECLWEWAGLVKSCCGCEQDLSRVAAGVSRICQDSLVEQERFVKIGCRSEHD